MAILPPARDDVVPLVERSSSRGMSAGSFWRSPSIGTRISPRARSSAAESAAVWPQFRQQEGNPHMLGIARPGFVRAVPPCRRSSRRRRRSARTQRQRAKHGVELGMERLDIVDLVEDGDQHREIEATRVGIADVETRSRPRFIP